MSTNFQTIIENQKKLICSLKSEINNKQTITQKEIVNLRGEISFADRTINKLKNVIAGSNLSIRDFNLVTGLIEDYYHGKK